MPLVVLCAGGMHSALLLLLALKVAVGLLAFFVSRCP